MGTVLALKEWRRCQLEERLRAGELGDWRVTFTDALGKPVNPEWVGKKFRRLAATTRPRAVAFGEEHELHGRPDKHAEHRFGALAIAI